MKMNSAAAKDVFTYVSSQSSEQRLSTYRGRFVCRYAYGRAMESLVQGEKGQDFVGVHIDGDVCNFVLCDGVSMSYRGDFAARFLGHTLLEWLGKTREWSSAGFAGFMREITVAASAQLKQLIPPSETPSLLREVLEDKQRLGSQTMYICGRIELPTSKRKQGRIWMAWQGDSRLRFWRHETEISEHFRGTMQTNERWSTLTGPVGGQPHVYQTRLEYGMPMRLQLYTDGLDDLDPIREPLPDEQIQVLLEARHTGGLQDDAAFLELKW
ncbi:hypothetical protein NYE48_10075 [Paenibacillus sp. FSL M7-1455]|uniref:PPM-type phosphatase domain-containing protein n=1 Tax=Paenibacillus cookii TaxID=157839 RepID=A0ABQ4LUM6_9BACL|nr:hypothetical protein [Paenibacillus cookii]KHF37187.1 hypothetical protein CM49_00693 [Paenibacillus sp. P1XP2]GIO66954.1 hypothetical protein J21TS3_17750 [Paenibacillus cookii]HWO53207.1 hypothetical protein [Paenibacillus cookii]